MKKIILLGTNQTRHIIAAAVLVLAFLMVGGCAGMTSQGYVYKPTEEAAKRLSTDDARRIISNSLPFCYDKSNRYINFLGYRTDRISDVHFYDDHFTNVFRKSASEYRIYYSNISDLSMQYVALGEWPDYFEIKSKGRIVNTYLKKEFQEISMSCNMIYSGGPMPFGESAKVVADALLRMKIEFDETYGPAAEEQFRKSVDEYKASGRYPDLPETVKTYDIQATTAVKNKNFETASEIYAKAIAIAPWWAKGHFNRALILAELTSTDAAVVEMQRYLYLVPNAPNAQEVRVKIAEWGTPAY